MKSKDAQTAVDQEVLVELLKGARQVEVTDFLLHEIAFYLDMKAKFGKDKLVEQTESRLRDLMWVFAKAANEAFPEERQISQHSLGLLNEPIDKYTFKLIIAKR